jgi:hypothetical protein
MLSRLLLNLLMKHLLKPLLLPLMPITHLQPPKPQVLPLHLTRQMMKTKRRNLLQVECLAVPRLVSVLVLLSVFSLFSVRLVSSSGRNVRTSRTFHVDTWTTCHPLWLSETAVILHLTKALLARSTDMILNLCPIDMRICFLERNRDTWFEFTF